MKREKVLKIILVLIIGSILLMAPIKTFAAQDVDDFFNTNTDTNTDGNNGTGDTTDNNKDEMESLGGRDDLIKEEEKKEEPKQEQQQTQQPTQQQKPTEQESLPKAGLVEDTMLIVTVLALIAIAVITFVKISEYSNI